jgi:hypothetical protein
MTFRIVSHRKTGHKGGEYWHGYIPLVLARVLKANEESALFMLSTLGKAVRELFRLKLELTVALFLTMQTVLSMPIWRGGSSSSVLW